MTDAVGMIPGICYRSRMQTNLDRSILSVEQMDTADAALRRCVHCGFCNATCPTYQLLGNELDGPRGRIYLIKQVLEGKSPSDRTLQHLDRCLTCRACETTCPSSVPYARLLEIGRSVVNKSIRRPATERLLRYLLLRVLPHPRRVRATMRLYPFFKWILPATLRTKFTELGSCVPATPGPQTAQSRQVLLLRGCVQEAVRPDINAATVRVLSRLGISARMIPESGCCGALSHHLDDAEDARQFIRRNIDTWWPYIEQGYEAVIATSSACSLMLKDYGRLLANDPDYCDRAGRIAEMAMDLSEFVAGENFAALETGDEPKHVAVHLPCTCQHGQTVQASLQQLVADNGNTLATVQDSHICCGAAGTYSISQPELSEQLRHNRLQALEADGPDCIVTANIGCLLHLQARATVPVRHWVELFDQEAPGNGYT